MTREEVKAILARIDISFPSWKPKDLTLVVDAWLEMLGEYDYVTVATAVKTYILTDTTGFAPSIGAINHLIHNIQSEIQGEELNEQQAWALVRNAICDGIYHSIERFEKLPPLVQKAVGSADNIRNWAQTDIDTLDNVVASNFQRTYRAELSRSKQTQLYPNEVRQLIATTTQKLIGKEDYE